MSANNLVFFFFEKLDNIYSYDFSFIFSNFTHFIPQYIEWVQFIGYHFDFNTNTWYSLNNNVNSKVILFFFLQKSTELISFYSYYFLDFINFKYLLSSLTYFIGKWTSLEAMLISLDTTEIYMSSAFLRFYVDNVVLGLNMIFNYDSKNPEFYVIFIQFLDYCILVYFLAIFLLFLISCYQNIFSETYSIDLNYLFPSISILAEKEVNCLDDLFNFLIIFFFLFGWFFYLTGFFNNIYLAEIKFLVIIIPFFCYSLILIPFFLLIDFSYNFVSYLRGISVSASLAVEFIFDYINFLGFVLRTYVQNVRFILILLVCFSINELWLFFDLTPTIFSLNKPTFDEVFDQYSTYNSYTYVVIFFFLKNILYFLYEIVHTFIIIVIQLSSFLIMIFWLFSFLYTYFSILLHENFFEKLREEKLKKYNLK